MKFNFKKIMSICVGSLMLASTVGFASAATLPAPFDSGSAIVYGAAGDVTLDMAAAVNIRTAIGQVAGSTAGIPDGSWQVKMGSSNILELNESINSIATSIGSSKLPILTDGALSNEKGEAKYTQSLYFDDVTSSKVIYAEDSDDNIGLFYKITSGQVIARYVMSFTSSLKSDITSGELDDVEDKEITFLGKSYSIIDATNGTSGVELTLMSGANKVTVANGEELTVNGKTVSVLVSSSTEAQFTIDGQSTDKLNKGGTAVLSDGSYLGVSDITYQGFAGGLMQATAYIGADKIELKNASSLSVNGETIGDAAVTITSTESSGDITISQLSVNMTAGSDYYVPVNGKLSANPELDEPGVLLTQNWDIAFNGLNKEIEYEDFSIKNSGDTKMVLNFVNNDEDKIEIPLAFVNASGIFMGQDSDKLFVLNASSNITKNDYFILNTANPTLPGSNAKTYIVQYKGASKATSSNAAKMDFKVIGGDSESIDVIGSTGTLHLDTDFAFTNLSSQFVNDFPIRLTSTEYDSTNGENIVNYLRTKNNALINITDTNITNTAATLSDGAAIKVTLVVDDTNRDGSKYVASASHVVVAASMINSTADTNAEVTNTVTQSSDGTSWITDNSESTKSSYIDFYGNEIAYSAPSGTPAEVTVKIPESIVEPLVYVTSGAVTVSAGTTDTGGLAPIVDDSKITTVQDKNLVIVGGSCVNKIAAKLLGSEVPLCGAAFTAKTNVGSGSYIIDTFTSPYNDAKVAMLVAGYEGTDTVAAAKYVADEKLSPDVADAAIIGPVIA